MRHRRVFQRVSAAAFLIAPCTAAAFELPPNLPTRSEGLWEIDRTGTIGGQAISVEIRKVWNVCLDAKADRALHRLETREEQASVATLNARCEDPVFTVSGETLSSTMHCSGPSRTGDGVVATEISRITTFVSSEETRTESVTVNRGGGAPSGGRFVTRMKRLGDCPGDLNPGDMTLMHWQANGEETLKARQAQNIYRETESYETFIASQLAR